MKKILLTLILTLVLSPVYAVTFGTYKTETEYGLIDGCKWNFVNGGEGQPLVQLKSETKEEQIRLEKEKLKPKEEQDDIQLYRFMLEDTVAY